MVIGAEQRTNRLLTLLSDDDYERPRPQFSISKLDYKKVLYEARREIKYVYFPIDGVASPVLEIRSMLLRFAISTLSSTK